MPVCVNSGTRARARARAHTHTHTHTHSLENAHTFVTVSSSHRRHEADQHTPQQVQQADLVNPSLGRGKGGGGGGGAPR